MDMDNRLSAISPERPMSLFFCTCIISFVVVLHLGNYTFANDEEGSIRKTIVEEKYKKVHHKSRRIGRNRYTQGESIQCVLYESKVRQ